MLIVVESVPNDVLRDMAVCRKFLAPIVGPWRPFCVCHLKVRFRTLAPEAGCICANGSA